MKENHKGLRRLTAVLVCLCLLLGSLAPAALALDARELSAACAALDARVLVAREQRPFLDRLRDPLAWFGGAS